MGVNSLHKTITRQRRGCDMNPGPSAPESQHANHSLSILLNKILCTCCTHDCVLVLLLCLCIVLHPSGFVDDFMFCALMLVQIKITGYEFLLYLPGAAKVWRLHS